MSEPPTSGVALALAGRRALGGLIQAAIDGLRSVESVMGEIGHIASDTGHHVGDRDPQRIDIE